MIRTSVLTVAVFCLLASPALAINPDLQPNSIGIWFEPTADTNCATPPDNSSVTAYVVSYEVPRDAGIGCWEATVLINPTSFTGGITFDIGPDAVNALTAPAFKVSYALAHDPHLSTLLTITFAYETGPVVLGIAPAYPSSFGAGGDIYAGVCPGWAAADFPELLGAYSPSSNALAWTLPIYRGDNTELPETGPINGYVVAGVNVAGPCPIANERSTWGSVKDLYR